jgi:hypothetical protein
LDKGKPDQIKSVMFVRGQTECLWLYSLQDWEHKLARERETLDDDKSRLFMHFIVSETTASEIDRSGRICVPRRLRELAGSTMRSSSSACTIGWRSGAWRKGDGRGELVSVLSFIELYLHNLAEGHIIDEVEQKFRVGQLAKFFQGLA